MAIRLFVLSKGGVTMEAMKVAEFIITQYYNMNKPITNLKLQKLLYFVQGASLAIFDEPAFTDTIEAWRYGPVVPNVYYPYSLYGPLKIRVKYEDELEDGVTRKIALFISHYYKDTDPFDLVRETHEPNSPWDKVYNKASASKEITIDSIKSYFRTRYLAEWFPNEL